NKWIIEAASALLLSEKQLNYVMDELNWYASSNMRDPNGIEISIIDEVWQADHHIPSNIKQSLLECVGALENISEDKKDWHPGSNNQVLDLVHPSLFCLVNGETRITR